MKGNILIQSMTYQHPSMTEPLFQNVSVSIHDGWKLGLVGRNGRGKTSFLNLLRKKLHYEGVIQFNLEFTYFPDYPVQNEGETTLDMLTRRNKTVEVWEIERELSYMRLPEDILERDFYTLSGGEQVKVLLIELFLNDHAFPLIDEPTNNLDLDGRQIVGAYLRRKSGYIVVSHDEAFLNMFVDHILAINKQSVDLIAGNVETWKYEKANADALSKEKNEKLKSEINRLSDVSTVVNSWGNKRENSTKDASERRLAAKQMKRAKAIKKRTEDMIEEKRGLINNIEEPADLKMRVSHPIKRVASFRDFSILRDGMPLFEPITFEIHPGDRCFIEGKNGIGKSTLLSYIRGDRSLETMGDVELKVPRNTSMLSQNNGEEDYPSLLAQLTAKEKEAYWHFLHQLGMKRTQFKASSSNHWSSGEQRKMFLANALLGENELFIWDEVTNSLDLYVINQLMEAINTYEPTMIAVDHNEAYVEAVATKRISLRPYT
ncbi:ABC transporter ATP-binding protein [Pontibacillus halophilus JSM 076056 = DSM 19796]|uniref:ABC transporter ATP-binding protein n=1 Tax=Pontibacillus halophilus JSM 076056 = DSM 19796 TaxID=1385510 RepID=A0A0A5I5M7_9BACI|nr:ATP-binding cassette domain-containing protein [Pontibacillus halophilus]KGX91132.1 ABC transporter ATP-binding protein [Pontibacillus halophilus JSM 076056 = DSM 19796]